MIRALVTWLTVTWIALAPVHALEIEGVKLEDKITLGPHNTELVLNGAGVRTKLMFAKVYVGGLYLTHKTTETEAVLANPGPKRVVMHFLAEEVTAPELIQSMNDALAANHIPAALALLEGRIRRMNRMMSRIGVIRKGGVVHLDYIPGTGTRVTVNGEEKITIPGEDFYRAMLRVWIGAKPVDGKLRNSMLGDGDRFRLF
ncbi:MAG: chalcone isomerase family protein [Betaproteobacteria bacterium]|nr:chalcone isomerase family protein [Betaproteobacteria bacterium]